MFALCFYPIHGSEPSRAICEGRILIQRRLRIDKPGEPLLEEPTPLEGQDQDKEKEEEEDSV